jgi:TPP-dependent pyruvate/acetoin dehydrogenase alpha subunit
MIGLENLPVLRKIDLTPGTLIKFEEKVAAEYEAGEINGPIHLANGNEEQLIEIFSRIAPDDFVFSAWRNHYHALLHGVDPDYLLVEIREGRSMGVISDSPNFFSSSIVGGIVPIALGTALGYSYIPGNSTHVWCFIGDMTYESGLFWEAYKFSRNHSLPLTFIVEDNGKSVTTDTKKTWNGKMEILDGVVWYEYNSKYPHHGTGKWVNF